MQVFYSLLIPPIVFYAGFSVKKKLFFKNLVTIAIFGILGCNLTGACLSPDAAHSEGILLLSGSYLPVSDLTRSCTLRLGVTYNSRIQFQW
jgi:hypothetical protein